MALPGIFRRGLTRPSRPGWQNCRAGGERARNIRQAHAYPFPLSWGKVPRSLTHRFGGPASSGHHDDDGRISVEHEAPADRAG